MKFSLGISNFLEEISRTQAQLEFQILKDDAVKVLHSICQQIWKTHMVIDQLDIDFVKYLSSCFAYFP